MSGTMASDISRGCRSPDALDCMVDHTTSSRVGSRRRSRTMNTRSWGVAAILAWSSLPTAMAQDCFALSGSTTCPGFGDVQIAPSLSGTQELFSFLDSVSDSESFDAQLSQFIGAGYAQSKYQDTIGCSSVNLTDTSNLYARYTTSVVCNAVIQSSASICSPGQELPAPLCAASCATFATSEQEIVASPSLCGDPGPNANDLIRADFVTCSAPDESLRERCIDAAQNEPNDCGYSGNLPGLCGFCGGSSPNATDSCCINSNVEDRCEGVVLPTQTSMPPIFTSPTAAPTATSGAAPTNDEDRGLSGGQIAGIVIGSILGALLLLALIILIGVLLRRRRQSQAGSIFNQPSPARSGPTQPMIYNNSPRGTNAVPSLAPGGRVARMTALESGSNSSARTSGEFGERPAPANLMMGMGGPPRRTASLSSNSQLMRAAGDHSPPGSSSGDPLSSPEGNTSGQSEQLDSFKDYYSQDDIHPNDAVATLWAYQPRAADEFELERGDMLKVVGIWDDGWATGMKLNEKAEDWERRRDEQRDSAVGQSMSTTRSQVFPVSGDIKAFPLVCVCLPQHWRKTIEGDTAASVSATAGGSRDGSTHRTTKSPIPADTRRPSTQRILSTHLTNHSSSTPEDANHTHTSSSDIPAYYTTAPVPKSATNIEIRGPRQTKNPRVEDIQMVPPRENEKRGGGKDGWKDGGDEGRYLLSMPSFSSLSSIKWSTPTEDLEEQGTRSGMGMGQRGLSLDGGGRGDEYEGRKRREREGDMERMREEEMKKKGMKGRERVDSLQRGATAPVLGWGEWRV